jgi:hypothetical protein
MAARSWHFAGEASSHRKAWSECGILLLLLLLGANDPPSTARRGEAGHRRASRTSHAHADLSGHCCEWCVCSRFEQVALIGDLNSR